MPRVIFEPANPSICNTSASNTASSFSNSLISTKQNESESKESTNNFVGKILTSNTAKNINEILNRSSPSNPTTNIVQTNLANPESNSNTHTALVPAGSSIKSIKILEAKDNVAIAEQIYEYKGVTYTQKAQYFMGVNGEITNSKALTKPTPVN